MLRDLCALTIGPSEQAGTAQGLRAGTGTQTGTVPCSIENEPAERDDLTAAKFRQMPVG